MKNINELTPKNAIVFEDENGNQLLLIEGETSVLIITDNTDFEEAYTGIITTLTIDGLEVENLNDFIKWEYILSIEII